VVNTEAMLHEDGFGENSIYKVFVAEEISTTRIVGMALYYTAYSTWKGKIFFLDDLVVTQQYRQHGLGKLLINEVLKAAREARVEQIRWQVLNWNEPAIRFYEKIGAELDPEWITCKMAKHEIESYLKTT
jgi:GNAT superfamily N-acetyltransferase